MEQICKTNWPRNDCKLGHSNVAVCAWSSRNLFAFSVDKEVEGHTKHFLNILNPNQPWDVFCMPYKNGEITCLKWDHTGLRLLSGDSQGFCSVWTMNNYMSNSWSKQVKHSLDLLGEQILAVGWLHHGVRVLFHIDKTEVINLNERFNRIKFSPSAMQYGGKHIDGYVIVTTTGLVSVNLLKSGGETTSIQKILNVPCHQQLADVAFTSQGKIAILTSNGEIQQYILFHELELLYDSEDETLNINVISLPSLALKCSNEEQTIYTKISHAVFVSGESPEHILACVAGPTGSKIESWLLRKESLQLHPAFQQASILPEVTSEITKSWTYVTRSDHMSRVLNFSVSPLAMDHSSSEKKVCEDSNFYSGLFIAVALADNTIQILHRIFLKPLTVQHIPETESSCETFVGKKLKITQNPSVQHVTLSTIAGALIALDAHGSLLLYRLPPWINVQGMSSALPAIQQVAQLLLYCLFTGSDWWDVLLLVQPNEVNQVLELVSTEMSKQSSSMQQVLQSRFLSLKINLYQISASHTATDCHIKLLFDAIALVFRSLVRPPQQVTAEENDPAIKLQHISCTSHETDISNLLQNVDTDPQSLLSMQQLIQWVADIALYLLASVPFHGDTNRPGCTLLRDRGWLSILRELLVIIRVWGLLKSACSPVFHVLDPKIEILPHIFRLITLLWQSSSDDIHAGEMPTNLIKDCYLVPSQVLIPPLDIITPVNGILSHLVHSTDLRLMFGQPQYDLAIYSGRQQRMEFVAIPGSSGKVDSLRRTFLGKKPNQELKECTRCGITTMYNGLTKSTLKVWEQRFVRSCLCGGLWKKVGLAGSG